MIQSVAGKISVLNRIPSVKGVAHTFLFLASDLAEDITGASLTVDTGYSLLGAM